ncbi:hypothetical protein BKA69DRAFT_141800 [Paraphysoderma sedebokerense]|nr:hypothetical protein BKA69DRAFT_141800 [Paraphysoderma sedebokerense]
MTHLSDYSYIDRGLSNYVFLLYILFRYYRVDPTFETFRRFNLKSACAGLLVASLLFGLVYDTSMHFIWL